MSDPHMANPSLLLLSGGTGAGHTMAARALEEEWRAAGWPVTHLDAYVFISRLARWAYVQLHLGLMEFIPEVYGPLYERGSRSRLLAQAQHVFTGRSRRLFAVALTRLRPDVVCATHPLGAALAAPDKDRWGYRLAILTTDYRAHAFHVHPNVDLYCASSPWAKTDLLRAGIPGERITITGIPLRGQFDRLPTVTEARAALRLPPGDPVVLVSRGGMAAGSETVPLLEALLASPALRQGTVVAILGSRDRGLRLVRRAIGAHPRLRVERFVQNMETYLAAADVVVGKPGGLFSTEVFSSGCPFVMYAPNEGIETANVRRFLEVGAAVDAGRSTGRAVAAVTELLQSPERRATLAAAGRSLLTPQSRQAARGALAALARAPVPPPAARGSR